MGTGRLRALEGALLVFASSLMLMAGEASAADLYSPPPLSLKDAPIALPPLWQGFYFGGHVGGGWDGGNVTDQYEYVGDPTATIGLNGSGVISGGQAGYNFQDGNIVYGFEADLGYLGLSGTKSVALPIPPDCLALGYPANMCGINANYSSSGGLYGDITGRVGFTEAAALFYVKGGAAFLNADIKANYVGQNCSTARTCSFAPVNPSTFSFEQSDTLWGWTVGAGIEYALSPDWSIKVEYLHFDFGSTSFAHNGEYHILGTPWHSTFTGNAEVSATVDAVMVGVNYHLNPYSVLR